jgi:uncharacterized protein (PEP-CTERM system associated)
MSGSRPVVVHRFLLALVFLTGASLQWLPAWGQTFGPFVPGVPGALGPGFGAPGGTGFGAPGGFGTGIGSSFPTAPTFTAAQAQAAGQRTSEIIPFVIVQETLSSNYTLTENRQPGLISQISPGFRVREIGSRFSLTGSAAAVWTQYIPTSNSYSSVAPAVSLIGNAAVIQRFFFVEAAVVANRTFYSPLGPVSSSSGVAPQNQYTYYSYRISPYIQGVAFNNISYLIRNDNVWTTLSGAPTTAFSFTTPSGNSYLNRVFARVASPVNPGGWALEYDRNQVDFTGQSANFLTEVGRGRLFYNVNESLQLNASGGWENNNYFSGEGGQYSGAIYGGGLTWRPSPRTSFVGNWEHRFFGSSYLFSFQHRRPLSAFNLFVARNVTSYPQQLASLPGGASTASTLDSIFASRIPDQAQRTQFVDQLIASRGLPSQTSSSVSLFTAQLLLFEQASAVFTLIGVRNTASLNLFRYRQQPITAEGVTLPPSFLAQQNNTQIGGALSFTHNLTSDLSLLASATYFDTSYEPPLGGSSNTLAFRAQLNNRLSTKTNVFAGTRYQLFRNNVTGLPGLSIPGSTNANEVAIFAGINHTF